MTKIRLFFLIGVAFVGAVYWVQNAETDAIDRCLDAGGRWNFDEKTCDT